MEQLKHSKSFNTHVIPGILLSFIIAVIAKALEEMIPVNFIGASVLALFMGILINTFIPINETPFNSGVMLTSKRVLKLAIILLGASLNITTILAVGKISLVVMVFTLIAAFGGGYILGKAMGLDWRLSGLISSGTGICGGSAIAAVSPIIDAEDHQISYAMSSTFIFDMFMIILFPLMGQWLGLSDMAYGLWTGTAVNDTSSVVAAGYAFSEAAGDFATMVKLTRTLAIIPTVIMFSIIQIRVLKRKAVAENGHSKNVKVDIKNVFPWFILGFLGMAFLHSVGIIPMSVSVLLKDISKFLMVVALAAIGLNTNLGEMRQSGIKPMIHSFVISVLVIIVSLVVQYALGFV